MHDSSLTASAPAQSWRGELKGLIALAWPLAFAQAGNALMGLVDTAVVGRVSAAAQGAVGLGNGLFFAFTALGLGVVMAFDPLISQAVGARQLEQGRSLYWQGVWLSLLLCAALAVPIAVSPLLLPLVGVDPDVSKDAAIYVWWRLPHLPAMCIFVAARAYLQASGRTTTMFVAMVAANIVNFALDVGLVFGFGPVPAMGVAGAALASSFSGWAQTVVLLVAFDRLRVDRRPRWAELSRAFRIGLPIGLQMLAEVGVFTLAGVLAGRDGPNSVAAHQVAITWASFSFCFAVGIGSAASTRVGWAVGAQDTALARARGLASLGVGAGVMTVSALVFLLAPELPARAMTGEPQVLQLVVSLFGVCAVFQVFDGLQAVAAGALRGVGDTQFAFWANVVGHYGVGLPVALVLSLVFGLGVVGLWWGLCAGLIVVSLALSWRFERLTQKPVRAL